MERIIEYPKKIYAFHNTLENKNREKEFMDTHITNRMTEVLTYFKREVENKTYLLRVEIFLFPDKSLGVVTVKHALSETTYDIISIEYLEGFGEFTVTYCDNNFKNITKTDRFKKLLKIEED